MAAIRRSKALEWRGDAPGLLGWRRKRKCGLSAERLELFRLRTPSASMNDDASIIRQRIRSQ